MTPGPSATQYQFMDPGNKKILINMVLADAADYSDIDENPATGWLPGGTMAFIVADRILMRRSSAYPQNNLDPQGAPLPDGRICICFTKFGVDNRACDEVPAGNPEPGQRPWFGSPLRYFHEEDRIPGIDEVADFPVGRDHDDTNGLADNRSARTYRHPFLINAGPVSPMRAWMQDFVDTYKMIQTQNNNDSNPNNNLPNPDRFSFDTGTLMAGLECPTGVRRAEMPCAAPQHCRAQHHYTG